MTNKSKLDLYSKKFLKPDGDLKDRSIKSRHIGDIEIAADITGGSVGGWVVNTTNLYSLGSGSPSSSPTDGIVMDSSVPVLTMYENTEKRLVLGSFGSGVFGLKIYDDDGITVLFETSDNQKIISGWTM